MYVLYYYWHTLYKSVFKNHRKASINDWIPSQCTCMYQSHKLIVLNRSLFSNFSSFCSKKKSSQKNTLIQPLITPLNSIDENNLIPHSLLLEIIKFVSEMKKESLIADNRLQNQIKSFDRADLTREVGLWHRKRDGFRRRNDPPRGSIDRSIDRLTQFRATLTGDACDWPIQYTHTHAHV